MNIQLPIVLWTVICFLIMMAVLRGLLFKPVLKLLDERKEKLRLAREKTEKEQELLSEHEKRLELISEDAKIQRENYIKSELEIIRVKSKADAEAARASRLRSTEEYRGVTEKEKEELIASFNASSEDIARAFADSLVSQK